jgi:heptosyltransferase-2
VREVLAAPFVHGALQLRARWRLGRELRLRRYDQAIVLPNTWKSALVPFFADIPLRSGYIGESRYGLLNLRYRKTPADMRLHYARLSEPPGKEPDAPLARPQLRVSPEEIAAVKAKFGLRSPYVALCPGAEYGPAKRWPYFAGLSRKIYRDKAILGSAGDAEAARDVEGTSLVGRTSLDEAIVVIAGASHVVSNDSGLMHVAAALGRPQVAIFGSSSPEHTPPHSPAARVLWLRLECSPCFQRECPLGHFRCMRDIPVEAVLQEMENPSR